MLAVTDTGIGIPAADQERIFERFFRSASATRQVIPGTGLGLTITKAIVDAHHGTITVDSRGGRGQRVHRPATAAAGARRAGARGRRRGQPGG